MWTHIFFCFCNISFVSLGCELMKGIECKQGKPLLAYDGVKYCSACDLMKTACQEMKIIRIESFTSNGDGCLSYDRKTNPNKDKKDNPVKSTQTTKFDNSDRDIGKNKSNKSDKVIP